MEGLADVKVNLGENKLWVGLAGFDGETDLRSVARNCGLLIERRCCCCRPIKLQECD